MNIRHYLLWVPLLFLFQTLNSQVTVGGIPLGLQKEHTLLPYRSLALPAVDLAALEKEDEQLQVNRFAAPIAVDITPGEIGNWSLLADGTQVWQLHIQVAEAKGLLLFYEDFHLPPGSTLFVYAPNSGQVLGAYTSESQARGDRFMTGIIHGAEAVIEYHAPADDFTVPFHIWRVDAVYKDSGPTKGLGFDMSSDCHDNVVCPTGDGWEAERNAVARIMIVVEEGTGFCTGTLVNNTAADGRLLFYSAFHCMDGFTPQFDLWRFDFYYASPTCTNPLLEPDYRSVLGCDSLTGCRMVDMLLLDLHPETAQGMDLHFVGWDRDGVPPQSGAVISHPLGDIQKIATSNTPGIVFPNTINWNNGLLITPPNHHYEVSYNDGFIEVGSSGAAMLDQDHRLVGHLHGASGTTICDQTDGFFGRMSVAWECDPTTPLSTWLDPLSTDTMYIDALGGLRSPLIKTDTGLPVPNVEVSIFLNDELVTTHTTDATGLLELPDNLPTEGTLRLEFSKGGSYVNGVTTTDLIRMQRHVLTTVLLDPYKMLACDVNQSNSVSTLDMIRIRKAVLTLTPDFGTNSAPIWQFFPETRSFTDPLQPWEISDRTNSYTYELSPSLWLPDFVVVKSGDANGSAVVE